MQAVHGEVEQTTEGLVQHAFGVMLGEVLKFKFSFSIELLCLVDSFILRNPARTPSAETLAVRL
jgi:hypothetical protein